MRSAQVLAFIRRAVPRDWSAQDLAEFYRVEAALLQAGLRITSARGLTDEGDPWFVFCRGEDEEVIIHFARIDGQYLISAPSYCGDATGHDFRALVRDMIDRHPVLRPRTADNRLFLHPAALLVMLVTSAFLKAGQADAAAAAGQTPAGDLKFRGAVPPSLPAVAPAALSGTQDTLLLSAINVAIAAAPQADAPVSAAPEHATANTSEPPPASLAAAIFADKPHDTVTLGSSAMGSSVPPQPGSGAPPDAGATISTHTASQGDSQAIRPSGLDPWHIPPPPDSAPFPAAAVPTGSAADDAAAAQHQPPFVLAQIPQADKAILQLLGVTDSTAYTTTVPAAIATVIHSGVHTSALNTHVETGPPAASTVNLVPSPVPASPATGAVSASAPSPAPVETVSVPTTPPASPAPAVLPVPVPDMMTVLAIVQLFQAVEVQPALVLTAHGAIFYDAAAVTTQYSAVKSVTYDFGDGFSISLVGLPAELTHAGAHV